ncbi:hypothetical protein HYO99_gp21 [Roseobacter phage RD-1410W1-01]|uniref:Uncharacterized protein n=1 Tax=Roseobacter phage RD-1410W1-01 TaxID=1815984 RepID=A0A191VYG8_9CAUD|nr:hypothetical protein HYO99_gp21 [Roseobacter phage RD-1410W1-01]ANJ20755.1 hypothetical protein RDp01_gp21 [Roseobacter phage RD-1410W1-01]
MIYWLITVLCVSTILVVGQPRSHFGAAINRIALLTIIFTIICAISYYAFGYSIPDMVKETIANG